MPSLSPKTLLRRFAASGASETEQKALAKALGLTILPPPKRSKAGKPPINEVPMEKRTVTIHLEADAAEWLDKQPNKGALLREMITERARCKPN